MEINTVLIIDDDPKIRKTLCDILSLKGYDPTAVPDGFSAVNKVREDPPCIALIDLKLEDMSGLEVVKKIREISDKTECIVLTGHASQASAIDAVDLGAFSYVLKPYDMEYLLVTIQRAAEKCAGRAGLEESETRYRTMFENTGTATVVLEDDMIISMANAECERLTGYSRQDIEGKMKWPEFVAPEDLDRMKKYHVERRKKDDKVHGEYEFHLVDKHGDIKDIFVKIGIIPGTKKSIASIIDITVREQAKDALRKERDKAQRYLDIAGVIIVIIDPEFKTTLINQKGCEVLGYNEEEILGKRWFDTFVPETLRDDVKAVASKLLAGDIEPAEHFENPVATKSGKQRLIAWHNTVLRDEDGNITAMLSSGEDITARSQAEDDLKKSETRYRTILEDIEEGYFELDLAGNFTFFNDSVLNIMGYSRKELMGMKYKQYTSPGTADMLFKVFNRIYSTGEPAKSVSYGLIRKGRAKGFIELSASLSLMRGAEGRPIGFRGIARDVTKRNESERSLKESRERLILALKGADLGVWDWDLQTGNHTINNRWAEMLGYSVEEIRPHVSSWENLVHPDDLPRVRKVLYEHIEGKTDFYESEYRMRSKSGRWIWILDRGKVTEQAEDGQPIRATGTHLDITTRKQAEANLRESQWLLSQIIEQNTIPAFVIDQDHKILYWNNACEKLTGISAEDVAGTKDQWKAFYDEPRPLMADLVLEKVSEKELSQYYGDKYRRSFLIKAGVEAEDFFPHVGENGKWLFFTAAPLQNEGGNIIGAIETFQDITARKKAEEDKKAYEAYLRQAQKMEAMGTLAGGIAHDFNNILAAIIGYTELTRDILPEGSKGHANLLEVLKAADRARDLVYQILTFSRQVEGERYSVDVHLITEEALKLLRSTIPTSIKIIKAINKKSGTVLADPTQIHQVMMNLCTNAYHAIGEAGGTIKVALSPIQIDGDYAAGHPQLHEGPYIKLTISDTGCGMDSETRERIFDPFFTTKEIGKGTGLGLATVHGIVASLGGAIEVDSEPGKGTTFDIYLPRFGAEEEDKIGKPKEMVPRGRGERILLVDDEETILQFGKQMLGRLGYEVDTISGSAEALEMFRENQGRFDLVITDQIMPEMTGAQLAIRMLEIRVDIPIILTTGYSETIDSEIAKEIGIKEFIYKPFTLSTMGKTIYEVLHGEPVKANSEQ